MGGVTRRFAAAFVQPRHELGVRAGECRGFIVAPFRSISGVTRVARRNGCPLALEGPIYSSAGEQGRWTFRGQSGLLAGAERAARSVKLEQREASRARVSRTDRRTDGRTEG